MRLDLRPPWRKQCFCTACGRHVKSLPRSEAVEVLELLDVELDRLVAYGLVHVIDGDRLCKPSLFGKTGDRR